MWAFKYIKYTRFIVVSDVIFRRYYSPSLCTTTPYFLVCTHISYVISYYIHHMYHILEVNHTCLSIYPRSPVCVSYVLCVNVEIYVSRVTEFPVSIHIARGNTLKFHFSHTVVIAHGWTDGRSRKDASHRDYVQQTNRNSYYYYYFLHTFGVVTNRCVVYIAWRQITT